MVKFPRLAALETNIDCTIADGHVGWNWSWIRDPGGGVLTS